MKYLIIISCFFTLLWTVQAQEINRIERPDWCYIMINRTFDRNNPGPSFRHEDEYCSECCASTACCFCAVITAPASSHLLKGFFILGTVLTCIKSCFTWQVIEKEYKDRHKYAQENRRIKNLSTQERIALYKSQRKTKNKNTIFVPVELTPEEYEEMQDPSWKP